MTKLTELKKSILADGKIDAQEVELIKKVIYADGKIDNAEANFLFALNDGCSGAKNHASWTKLFVEAICEYLLADDNTPGEIDAKEAEWLLKKIQGDGKLDKNEKKLLKALKIKSWTMPENLHKFITKNA